ncbi:hypothetical protein ACJIZ3_014464 [Penstemon smallii]|uniref:Uncharacterized protein n=1 Tax=Penstemon smallii TaxID=265156 RepID=A0ABD3RN26_9LAMI
MAVKRTAFLVFCLAAVVSVGWAENAAEEADSWTDWAMKKFSEVGINLGSAKDVGQDLIGKTSEKLGDVMNYASGKANEAMDMDMVKDKASEMASDAKESMSGGIDKASDTYEDAKSKVHDAYVSAKDSMSEQAKEKYEAAKEKASQATGDLGADMRTGTAEL